MKKFLFVLVFVTLYIFSFAQDLSVGMQAKNDGNQSFRDGDFVKAIEYWEKYLNSGEEGVAEDQNTKSLYLKSFRTAGDSFMGKKDYASAYKYYEKFIEKNPSEGKKDGELAYRMAYCASKMDKNDLALSKYQECIALNYQADKCMFYIAGIYKDANNDEKMVATLKEALVKYPTSKIKSKIITMLTTPMLKEAVVPFNEANELAKAASTGDPAEYLSNMTKAVSKFEEAIPLFNEVLKYDPKDDQAKTYLNACKDNIKSFEDYKASLVK